MTQQGFSLKDRLFNAEKVAGLAARFAAPFDRAAFQAEVMAHLPALELKARIDWIAECLLRQLPPDFPQAAAAIRAALPPPLDPTLNDGDFGDFIYAPLGEVAVKAGLEAHPDLALDLLEDLTQRFSMEWALRPFLTRWPDKSWASLERWAAHPHYHVRRLVSEGTRPNLPWGARIAQPPGFAVSLLDRLHADPTRYVTRSIANHLNDITKTDPDLVFARLDKWASAARQDEAELEWMTRHALRSLLKAGDARALDRLGYRGHAGLSAQLALSPDPVPIGGTLRIAATLRCPDSLPVLVDYILHTHNPSGRPGRRVFRLKQGKIAAGVPLRLEKTHVLRGNATTYRLYLGLHRMALRVNGQVLAEAAFELTD